MTICPRDVLTKDGSKGVARANNTCWDRPKEPPNGQGAVGSSSESLGCLCSINFLKTQSHIENAIENYSRNTNGIYNLTKTAEKSLLFKLLE